MLARHDHGTLAVGPWIETGLPHLPVVAAALANYSHNIKDGAFYRDWKNKTAALAGQKTPITGCANAAGEENKDVF